jgi:GntR family transcriptional regulator, transcriptional repressor for pyruvate dehydrogenase complex
MLKKMKQSKLYEDVAVQIEESIIQGEFKPGEKLPSERELEDILGVSRSTIRQSLRILGQQNILKITTGAKGGAFVSEITPDIISKSISLLIRFNKVTPDHIEEFRLGIEGSLITRLAVENAEQDDIRNLKAMLNRLSDIGQSKILIGRNFIL